MADNDESGFRLLRWLGLGFAALVAAACLWLAYGMLAPPSSARVGGQTPPVTPPPSDWADSGPWQLP
jgi:hypothetical protein